MHVVYYDPRKAWDVPRSCICPDCWVSHGRLPRGARMCFALHLIDMLPSAVYPQGVANRKAAWAADALLCAHASQPAINWCAGVVSLPVSTESRQSSPIGPTFCPPPQLLLDQTRPHSLIPPFRSRLAPQKAILHSHPTTQNTHALTILGFPPTLDGHWLRIRDFTPDKSEHRVIFNNFFFFSWLSSDPVGT